MTTQQEFNCIFCNDVFDSKEELQEHFRKHGDPKFKNRSENDTQTCDEKSKEKVETVSCDVCSQVFPTISKAITHKHKVHPDHDAKYFCPWCGKLFTLKHLYNVHVESNHGNQEKAEDKGFHCDSCIVDFFIASAMINHNKFFHRQDTDLPDVGRSQKIKFYNQEVIPIYYCAFCGEEYENKVNLIKHISDDHEDENQSPDEVLKCPMCNAVFYHLDAYEIHLTFHSSEDMFSVRNNEFDDLLDYSLETVPPIIEKVENLETEDQNQDTGDAESALTAVGIEKFLELAMDQSDDSNPVKVKKHKKHKKSKKSAITLDEFLNMNKDVFGEGLDFHGIEEVPTRVVKKQLKNNKKATDAAVTSAELEKLKKAGIVVKRKVGRIPMIKGIKVANSKPIRNAQTKSLNKINPDQEIKTSSEVLSRLINQSNNQIKIIKKTNNATNEPKLITNDDESKTSHSNMSANYVKESNQTNEEMKTTAIPASEISTSQNITKAATSPKPEEPPVPANTNNSSSNRLSENDIKSDINGVNHNENKPKISVVTDIDYSSTPGSNKMYEGVLKTSAEINKNESDQGFEKEQENESDTDNVTIEKQISEIRTNSDNNSDHTNLTGRKFGSLSPLKHLSHLITVKTVSQNKNTTSKEPTNYAITETKDGPNSQIVVKKEPPNLLPPVIKPSPSKPKLVDKDPTMDALKTLSKNITVKSLSTKVNTDDNEPEDDSEIDDAENQISKCNLKSQDIHSSIRNMKIQKVKVEMNEPKLDRINNSLDSEEKKLPLIKQSGVGKKHSKIIVETDNSLPTTNANILKRLTNITTKPVIKNNNDLAPKVQQTKTNVQTEEKKEEIIEIFDIDDSEDEADIESKVPEPNQNSINSMDALKNLSKNITVKSLNQPTFQKNIKIENNIKIEKEDHNSPSYHRYTSNSKIVDNHPNVQNRNVAFQNVLQGLGKNITIKSRNSSPSQFLKSQDSKLLEDREDEESDPESCSGKIKITELDNEMEDNEDEEYKSDTNIENPIVESPNDSCSDNEEVYANERDLETKIQFTAVQKCKQNMNSTINSVCLNNLKNINKNITIKSISTTSTDKEDTSKQAQLHENLETQHQQKNQLQIKSSKQVIKEPQMENNISTNKNLQKLGQIVDHTSSQSSNKKISTINQVNSFNKEVTVKTFQTKTVIQEITTTVTKTIKTVNQTMKQEVRNTYQTSAPMVTQRVQGIRPNQQKNLQGVVIRHATPTMGPRPGNMVPQIRPASNVVRPPKQIVPMRAGISRPPNPRMAVGKKVSSAPSPNKQVLEKTLKISPCAMAATITKRSNTEDVSGPFSCFKKPKESLIPVSDVPPFTSIAGETNVQQYAAASHTSSSNFTSTTKVIKGKSVVTAKQTKSEVSASAQQLSRLSNTSGLKITSQGKQNQVQEKNENSAMKRTTLEAIERLQKQGLLVKKPRMEASEASENSDHDGDNNLVYSSTENDE